MTAGGQTGELVHVQPAMLAGLYPAALVAAATDLATELKRVIEAQGLSVQIGDPKYNDPHVKIEGWLTAGAMLQTFPHIISSEVIRNSDGQVTGCKATAVARTLDGRSVAQADALCTRDEVQTLRKGGIRFPWKEATVNQVMSMAQTRAASKVMGFACRWIITMAGYSGTPAEEMTPEDENGEGEPEPTGPTMERDPELTEAVAPEVAQQEARQRAKAERERADARPARDPATRTRAARQRQARPARVDATAAAGKLMLLPWDEFFQAHGINAAQAASIIRSRYPDALKPEEIERQDWPVVYQEGDDLPDGGKASHHTAASSAANELQRAAAKLTHLEPERAFSAQAMLVEIMADLPQAQG